MNTNDSAVEVPDAAVPGPAGRRHLPELDGIRAFAALGVIVEHYWPAGQFVFPGAIGVDVFFVLSGFLITRILLGCSVEISAGTLTRPHALRQFYIRRFLRIFPLYYFYLLLVFIWPLATYAALPWCATFLSNFYFVRHGFTWYVGHLWTLAVEEQFYILWPLIVLTLPTRFLTPVCVLVVLAGAAFKGGVFAVTNGSLGAMIWLPSCVDTLAFGGLLGVLSYTAAGLARTQRWVRLAMWPGLLIAGACIAFHQNPRTTLVGAMFFPIGVYLVAAWLIMHATGPGQDLLARCLTWGPLRYLGTISYGIYVWHIGMRLPMEILTRRLHLPPLPAGLQCLWVMAMSIGSASASWWIFERPINELKRYFPYSGRRRS